MSRHTLLESGELQAVEDCLNRGDLEQAQRRLARLGSTASSPAALNYLATRLLYLRDRLDPSSVAERMRELLAEQPDFPEARSLLSTAADGVRGPASIPPRPTVPAPPPTAELRQEAFGRPTVKPPQWPPPELRAALEADEQSDRPTAVPDEVPAPRPDAPRKIVVDTRASIPAAGPASSPAAWSLPRPRLDGSYAMNAARTPAAEPLPLERLPGEPLPLEPPAPPRQPRSASNRRASEPPRLQSPPGGVRAAGSAKTSSPPLAGEELWSAIEQQVGRGEHAAASEYFEEAARRQLSHLPPVEAGREPELLAGLCAELLNKSWVTHLFAPFDLSLQSLARVQVALTTVFGMVAQPEPASASVLLLGSYVGEVLRGAHRGRWHNSPAGLERASVRTGTTEWFPFDSVRTWLQSGGRAALMADFDSTLAKPGTAAWNHQGQLRLTQHPLWLAEPGAADLPELAKAVSESVFSTACGLLRLQRLDLSLESLRALDWLANVLIDSPVSQSGQEPWHVRNAVLLGAYAGEVFRQHAPGQWIETSNQGPDRISLQLHNGLLVCPAQNLLACAVGQRPSNLEALILSLLAHPQGART